MENLWDVVVVVLVTVAVVVALRVLFVLVLSGFNVGRIRLAIRASWRLLRNDAFGARFGRCWRAKPGLPLRPSHRERHCGFWPCCERGDGRFLDFVLEDVNAATDDQIAAAVRAMQPVWQRALREHLVLEPVRSEVEGSTVEVPAGFDPSGVLLTGNVTGQPPFRGTLKHPGWRVKEIKLPKPPEGQDEFVIMPAEVELP